MNSEVYIPVFAFQERLCFIVLVKCINFVWY